MRASSKFYPKGLEEIKKSSAVPETPALLLEQKLLGRHVSSFASDVSSDAKKIRDYASNRRSGERVSDELKTKSIKPHISIDGNAPKVSVPFPDSFSLSAGSSSSSNQQGSSFSSLSTWNPRFQHTTTTTPTIQSKDDKSVQLDTPPVASSSSSSSSSSDNSDSSDVSTTTRSHFKTVYWTFRQGAT